MYNLSSSFHCLRTYMFWYSDVIVIGHVHYYAAYVDPVTARTRICRILYEHIILCIVIKYIHRKHASSVSSLVSVTTYVSRYIRLYIFPSRFLKSYLIFVVGTQRKYFFFSAYGLAGSPVCRYYKIKNTTYFQDSYNKHP